MPIESKKSTKKSMVKNKILLQSFIKKSFNVSNCRSSKNNLFFGKVKQFVTGGFDSNPDFCTNLAEVDCVIHLAGKVHVLDKYAV